MSELLGAAALLLGEVALLCATMSELLVEEEALGGFEVELLGAAVLLCALMLWSEVVLLPVLPTPLELAASEGVADDGGVFCVWAAELPCAELTWPGSLALLLDGAVWVLADWPALLLMPLAADEVAD